MIRSDAMYSPSEQLVHIKGDPKRQCQIPTKGPLIAPWCPAPKPIDPYFGTPRYQTAPRPSRLMPRVSSCWAGVMGSADGTGYVATANLPPHQRVANLGYGRVTRAVIPGYPERSRLFIDDMPAVYYESGTPFTFKTDTNAFLYLIPSGMMVQVNGMKWRIDVASRTEKLQGCTNCF